MSTLVVSPCVAPCDACDDETSQRCLTVDGGPEGPVTACLPHALQLLSAARSLVLSVTGMKVEHLASCLVGQPGFRDWPCNCDFGERLAAALSMAAAPVGGDSLPLIPGGIATMGPDELCGYLQARARLADDPVVSLSMLIAASAHRMLCSPGMVSLPFYTAAVEASQLIRQLEVVLSPADAEDDAH